MARESKFVQEMFVPQLTISHYDVDTVKMIARDVCERYRISASLIKVDNCEVHDGVVVSREAVDWKV